MDFYRLRRLAADIGYPMVTGDSGPPLGAEAILSFALRLRTISAQSRLFAQEQAGPKSWTLQL